MDEFDFDPKKAEDEIKAQERERQNLAFWGGIGDSLANRKSFGEFFLNQHNPRQNTGEYFKGLVDLKSDTLDSKRKLLADYRKAKGERDLVAERQKGAEKIQELRSQYAKAKGRGSGVYSPRTEEALTVPGVGVARTPDDAKTLKDAAQMKAKFDRQIAEMIKLREDYGTEFLNREAVNRGKALSNDLLLTYKNLQKLGVLSKSDEAIVNSIIPSDPLETTANSLSFGLAPGGDPIMSQLSKFQADTQADYDTQVGLRTKSIADAGPRMVTVSNGQETLQIPESDLADAEADGFKALDTRSIAR